MDQAQNKKDSKNLKIKGEKKMKKITTKQQEKIIKTLGDSWNGIAVNGTPFTQWRATERFFNLWKEEKEKIKADKFSLYKHDSMGWVVTYFGESFGKFDSRDDYENFLEKRQEKINFEQNKKIVESLWNYEDGISISGFSSRNSLEQELERISEIQNKKEYNDEVNDLMFRIAGSIGEIDNVKNHLIINH